MNELDSMKGEKMNKQQLIKEIHKIVGEHCFDKLQVQDGWFNWLWLEKQINELDELSREECEFIEWSVGDDRDYGGCIDGAKCTNCDYFDAWYCDCDKINFCPNCGAKIKKEKRKDD